MDYKKDHPLPSYEDSGAASTNEALPSYTDGHVSGGSPSLPRSSPGPGPTLAIDPTGLFINQLAGDDVQTVYSLNNSLLSVNSRTSIHISRVTTLGNTIDVKTQAGSPSSSIPVYAIGSEFMTPLLNRKTEMQEILVTHTHGLLAATNLKERVWDFSINVPLPPKDADGSKAATEPGANLDFRGFDWLYGGTPPGMMRKHLLLFHSGKWVNGEGEQIALAREGGQELGSMPVLTIVKKGLENDMLDFLVAAWCVALWGEVGKRAKSAAKSDKGK